jgi:hypothetical protein
MPIPGSRARMHSDSATVELTDSTGTSWHVRFKISSVK